MVGGAHEELGIVVGSVMRFEAFASHLRHPGPIINGEPMQPGAPEGAFVDTLPLGFASWAQAANGEALRLFPLNADELDRVADLQVSF